MYHVVHSASPLSKRLQMFRTEALTFAKETREPHIAYFNCCAPSRVYINKLSDFCKSIKNGVIKNTNVVYCTNQYALEQLKVSYNKELKNLGITLNTTG